jgi:hypothetical protein
VPFGVARVPLVIVQVPFVVVQVPLIILQVVVTSYGSRTLSFHRWAIELAYEKLWFQNPIFS